MPHWTSLAPTVLASFMASMVEFVEALTIVLAVGLVRGWRSALLGTAAALAVLLALVAILGPSLARIPLPVVQLVVGTLLLMFGLRWLRKAILRAAGVLALHDENKAFAEETDALRLADSSGEAAIDRVAFGASFKIVMLEGVEVVFIVIAIGAGGPLLVPASVGAAFALGVVVVLGLLVHRPLANVPENTLKFGVGVLLSGFGSFWVGEGIGVAWPGADWAILALIAVYLVAALIMVTVCRRLRERRAMTGHPLPTTTGRINSSTARAMAHEFWGLFVDDGVLAAGVLLFVVIAWTLHTEGYGAAWVALSLAGGLNATLALSASRRAGA